MMQLAPAPKLSSKTSFLHDNFGVRYHDTQCNWTHTKKHYTDYHSLTIPYE